MIIGVISDTHDRLPMIDAALELFAECGVEAVVHAGDFVSPFAVRRLLAYRGPIHATFGNNDGERKGLGDLLPGVRDGPMHERIAGRNVLIHHFIDWCDSADVERADIIITGHTHEATNEVSDGKLFLNPGECCGWVTGKCTVAILDTERLEAEIRTLAESGARRPERVRATRRQR